MKKAQAFICDGFETADKAIAGACEILIESFSEDNRLRSWVYNEIWSYSSVVSSVKDETADDKKHSKSIMISQKKFLKCKATAF